MIKLVKSFTGFVKYNPKFTRFNFTDVRVEKFSNLVEPILVSNTYKEKYSTLLKEYGFKEGQMNRIFSCPHCIFSFEKKSLWSNLLNWLNFEVGDKLFTTLSAQPELLILSPDFVNNRAKELMTLFTKNDIKKLLVTCPNVFLEDFQNVYDKVQYIVTRMGVEQKSIVKSQALQFDLHHIKCRHNFMIFAGCYKLNKKAKKFRNAPLHKIFSRNIETFLKLSKLTEEEYIVFSSCFADEIDVSEDEDTLEEEVS